MEKNEAIRILQKEKSHREMYRKYMPSLPSEERAECARLIMALQLAIDALKGKPMREPGKQTQLDFLRTASPEQAAAELATVMGAIMQSDASLAIQSIEGEIYDWLMSERKG